MIYSFVSEYFFNKCLMTDQTFQYASAFCFESVSKSKLQSLYFCFAQFGDLTGEMILI